jgi:hypothetical protein
MTWDEYNKIFHKLQLNLVAFKPLMECDAEVLKLVNAAIEQEREACAKVLDEMAEDMVREMEPSTAIAWVRNRAEFIRARGNT